MPTEDVDYQQQLKIRRTTLGFGVIQVVLGLALTGLSFTAFVLSESEKIRSACPYWAGFTVFCSGGVGIVAWRHTTVLSMGLFTFFSAVCVVLHMIGTILTGEIGGLLKSIIMCQGNIIQQSCMCCDSIMTCKQNVPTFEFKGVDDCSIITGLMKELMYGLCVLNIFGSLVCFIATILGCTSVARQAGRDQPFFRRRLSARSDSHDQSQYSWLHYPADANVLPPYAPPIYRSVDNVQDCGATPYIVPPPVFDPTDLPPPYSSRNASLSSSGMSLNVQDPNIPRRPHDRDDMGGGGSSVVISEGSMVVHHHYENHHQTRVYSENRARACGGLSQISNVVLTRAGISERCGSGARIEQPIQSVSSSHISVVSEKAEECRESNESINNQENNYKSKPTRRITYLDTMGQSNELITFEENQNKRKKENKRNPTKSNHRKSSKVTEDEFSSTSDSGIGEEIACTVQETKTEQSNETQTNDAIASNKEVGINNDVGSCEDQQNYHFNPLAFSSRDDISIQAVNVRGSNDTLVNSTGSGDETAMWACHLENVGQTESLVNELPCALPMLHGQGPEDVVLCASSFEEGKHAKENVDFSDGEIQTVPQSTRNKIHEKHITQEMMRLMDDFEAKSNIMRTFQLEPPNQDLACAEKSTQEVNKYTHAKSGPKTDLLAQSHHVTKDYIAPRGVMTGTCSRLGREFLERNETSLARSDTCIAVLPPGPREMRTASDPNVRPVGSLTYPGLNHFPFQLVPPNVELPAEFQHENVHRSSSNREHRRRRRHGGDRELSRSKRRALANREDMMRLKANSQRKRSTKRDHVSSRHTLGNPLRIEKRRCTGKETIV